MINKIKILLVDEDEMTQLYFKDIFWVHGRNKIYDVDIVHSLEEAEKRINNIKTRPNTIFLDIILGLENKNNSFDKFLEKTVSFIEKIKEDKENSGIKIIIFSSKEEKYIRKRFPNINIDGYLKKGDLLPKEIIDYTDKIHGTNNKN